MTGTTFVTPSPAGLLPIPTSRVIRAKEGRIAEKLRYDVEGYGLNEVRKLLIEIAGEETAQQIRLDNPPAFTNVDGTRGRSIAFAKRRVTVSFGIRLKVAALTELKRVLKMAIEGATVKRTGRLADMSNWVYSYVRNGRREAMPLGGASGIPMGPRDFIVLMPRGVVNGKGQAYATAANMRVAGTGRLNFKRSARGRVSRKNQSIGFLAMAARVAQSSPMFDGFTVNSGFSARHAITGEVLRRFGVRTGFISVRPKTGRG